MIPRRKPYFHPKTLDKIIDLTVKHDELERLTRDLRLYLKLPNPVVVGQGRSGLKLILESSGIAKGKEVIIPAYTFGTLTKIIKLAGYIPRPVDIDYNTYEIDIKSLSKAINKNTGAILATHLFGVACDIQKIKKAASSKKILLIEDCAQALGSTLNGKLIGTFGDIAFSSFDISKPLQGIRGGVVFGRNTKIIKLIKTRATGNNGSSLSTLSEITKALVGYFLIQTPMWYLMMYIFGYKKWQRMFVKAYRQGEDDKIFYSLPSVYARVVRMNIPTFIKRLEKRRRIHGLYVQNLKNIVTFQKIQRGNSPSFYMILAHCKFDIFLLRRYLAKKGIDIALADEIADNLTGSKNSQVAKAIKDSIALPVYESMNEKDVAKVSLEIKNFVNSQ